MSGSTIVRQSMCRAAPTTLTMSNCCSTLSLERFGSEIDIFGYRRKYAVITKSTNGCQTLLVIQSFIVAQLDRILLSKGRLPCQTTSTFSSIRPTQFEIDCFIQNYHSSKIDRPQREGVHQDTKVFDCFFRVRFFGCCPGVPRVRRLLPILSGPLILTHQWQIKPPSSAVLSCSAFRIQICSFGACSSHTTYSGGNSNTTRSCSNGSVTCSSTSCVVNGAASGSAQCSGTLSCNSDWGGGSAACQNSDGGADSSDSDASDGLTSDLTSALDASTLDSPPSDTTTADSADVVEAGTTKASILVMKG